MRLAESMKKPHFLIYRPPSSLQSNFCIELDQMLAVLPFSSESIILVSDFNLYVENCWHPHSWICSEHGLMQVKLNPTYCSGHTLDCILSTFPLTNVAIIQNAICDHHAINFDIVVSCQLKSLSLVHLKFYLFCDLRTIDVDSFRADFDEGIRAINISSSQALFD